MEKVMFKRLASDLLQVVQEEREPSKGRKGHSIRTKLFALLLHTYTGKSSRRLISELTEAKYQGLLDHVPHFNSVLNFYEDEDLPELLKQLITIVAKPLAQVEQDFAVDSTGFGTLYYESWNNARYVQHRSMHGFRKAHVMSGVKTNIITAVNITRGAANDSPEFIPLLERTRKYFVIREVSADKAYSSRNNLKAVSQNGGIPYIPFRAGTTDRCDGAYIWRKMHQYFTEHKEEFLEHYHKRSNAETVFAMIKRKLGTTLRNRKEISQTNEILLKCLVHNIIVLIHEMFELGVNVDFNFCAEEVFRGW
jgi:transposase